jgi:5-methylthioadenosine/S-adenosylhomocysteine deaminase
LASGICDIPLFLKKNINVTIGVDGAACNNNLDIFKDMRLAALLAKISKHARTIPTPSPKDILKMVTIGGAKALGLDDKIGSIEKGKKADIIIVNLKNLETVPIHNILDSLIYSTDGHNVETVIIDGRITMRNRKVTTIDEHNLISKSHLRANGIAEKSGIDKNTNNS